MLPRWRCRGNAGLLLAQALILQQRKKRSSAPIPSLGYIALCSANIPAYTCKRLIEPPQVSSKTQQVQVGPGPRLRLIVSGLNGFLNRSIGAMFSRPKPAGLLTPRKT